MKRFAPLVLLGLAACNAPLEEQFPRQNMTFEQEDHILDVRLQKDPFEGWTARIASRHDKLAEDDRDAMIALVENTIGPKVCKDAGPIQVVDEKTWHRQSSTVMYLGHLGVWQIVGSCSGAVAHL